MELEVVSTVLNLNVDHSLERVASLFATRERPAAREIDNWPTPNRSQRQRTGMQLCGVMRHRTTELLIGRGLNHDAFAYPRYSILPVLIGDLTGEAPSNRHH